MNNTNKRDIRNQKRRAKYREKKNNDVFGAVSRNKKNIDKAQATKDRKERKAKQKAEAEARRSKDPISVEEHKSRKAQMRRLGSSSVRRRILRRGEKIGYNWRCDINNNPIVDKEEFTKIRKRQFIVAMTKPAYHCPRCGECKTKMSEWFLSKKLTKQELHDLPFDAMMNETPKRKVMCRSCVQSFGWDIKTNSEDKTESQLYSSIIQYYKIDPLDLYRKRKTSGRSVQQFAELVGWTASYQYRLENGDLLKLNKTAMGDLCSAFKRLNIEISLDIWGKAEKRFVIDGKVIKDARAHLGISQATFSKKAGWSKAYQNKIESGRVKSLSEDNMNKIRNIFTNPVQTVYESSDQFSPDEITKIEKAANQ